MLGIFAQTDLRIFPAKTFCFLATPLLLRSQAQCDAHAQRNECLPPQQPHDRICDSTLITVQNSSRLFCDVVWWSVVRWLFTVNSLAVDFRFGEILADSSYPNRAAVPLIESSLTFNASVRPSHSKAGSLHFTLSIREYQSPFSQSEEKPAKKPINEMEITKKKEKKFKRNCCEIRS